MDEYVTSDESNWLANNVGVIAEDLKNSKLVWVQKLPSGCSDDSCGCAFEGEDRIYLHAQTCEANYHDKRDWSKLLLHETMHHFVGNDEDKAKRLAVALWSIWYKMGHPDAPHWQVFKGSIWLNGQSEADQTKAFINNNTFVVLEDEWFTDVNVFDVDSNEWKRERIQTSEKKIIEKIDRSSHNPPVILNENLIAYGIDAEGFGLIDVAKKEITEKKFPRLDSLCKLDKEDQHTLLMPEYHFAADSKLISFGNCMSYDAKSNPRHRTFGAIYDLQSNRWQHISKSNHGLFREDSGSIKVGDRILILGGIKSSRAPKDEAPPLGLVYDLQSEKWSVVPAENAPPIEFRPLMTNIDGNRVLVIGSYDTYGTIFYRPAILNLETLSWEKVSPPPLDSARSVASSGYSIDRVGWTGSEAIAFVKDVILKYIPAIDRWAIDTENIYPRSALSGGLMWTGVEFLFWDSKNHTGYKYYP
jgi:hypothetical protein